MEEKEINALASAFIPYYKGVYTIDKIPHPPNKQKTAYIINTLNSKSKENVGHWFALIANKKKIYIFDPAGKFSIYNKHLKKYLKKIGYGVTTNFIPIQPKDSWYCGVYVLVFLYHMLVLKKTFRSYINRYRNTNYPDKKICRNFTKYFKLKCKNVVTQL